MLRPFFLPLFTEVRGIGILRTSPLRSSTKFAWLRALTYAQRVQLRLCASLSLRDLPEGEILGLLREGGLRCE